MISPTRTSPVDILTTFREKSTVEETDSFSFQSKVFLYQADNLEECLWPDTVDGRYAQALLTPFIKKGVSHFIENIKTELRVLRLEDVILPITINEGEYHNSYVCSPYSYFISYARESLDILKQPWLFHVMDRLLRGIGVIFRKFHFNKVVIVNNWFCSTNLYPKLDSQQIVKIAQFLRRSFPQHAIVFRCVDSCTNSICEKTLKTIDFEYIATRQIFFLNPSQTSLLDSRIFKSDLKLLKNSGYQIIEGKDVLDEEFPRLLELYRNLYIDKYSALNPTFNVEFLRLVIQQNLMHFKALKKDGRIDGVVGYVEREGKMYCPYFGYDGEVPQEVGLYRILSTVLMLEAYEKRLFFHQSSGASTFKKIRKADDCIEYTAVLCKHLKWTRRIPWFMLKCLYNTLGKSYMEKY